MSKSLFECTRFKLGCKIKLELIPDPDMYIFFEKGTRVGISYISTGLFLIDTAKPTINI